MAVNIIHKFYLIPRKLLPAEIIRKLSIREIYDPWDRDEIGIKLRTNHVIYKKFANFM